MGKVALALAVALSAIAPSPYRAAAAVRTVDAPGLQSGTATPSVTITSTTAGDSIVIALSGRNARTVVSGLVGTDALSQISSSRATANCGGLGANNCWLEYWQVANATSGSTTASFVLSGTTNSYITVFHINPNSNTITYSTPTTISNGSDAGDPIDGPSVTTANNDAIILGQISQGDRNFSACNNNSFTTALLSNSDTVPVCKMYRTVTSTGTYTPSANAGGSIAANGLAANTVAIYSVISGGATAIPAILNNPMRGGGLWLLDLLVAR